MGGVPRAPSDAPCLVDPCRRAVSSLPPCAPSSPPSCSRPPPSSARRYGWRRARARAAAMFRARSRTRTSCTRTGFRPRSLGGRRLDLTASRCRRSAGRMSDPEKKEEEPPGPQAEPREPPPHVKGEATPGTSRIRASRGRRLGVRVRRGLLVLAVPVAAWVAWFHPEWVVRASVAPFHPKLAWFYPEWITSPVIAEQLHLRPDWVTEGGTLDWAKLFPVVAVVVPAWLLLLLWRLPKWQVEGAAKVGAVDAKARADLGTR